MAQTMSPAQRKAFIAQMHYYDSMVTPQVVAARQKLEPYLSDGDKQKLAQYRARMQQMAKEQAGSFRIAPLRPLGNLPERDQQRREGIALAQKLEPLVYRYEGPIRLLLKELQPQKQRWAKDLTALYKTAGPPVASEPTLNLDRTRLLERTLTPFAFLTLDPNHKAPAALPHKAK